MNTRKLSAVAVLVASLSLFACDEQAVPTEQVKDVASRLQVPKGDRRIIQSIGDAPPPTAPPEYQQYTWIQVSVDVGWLDAHTAYGTTTVDYGANNATADISLIVRNAAGTTLGSNTGHAVDSYVFPGSHTLRISTTVYVTPTCGSIAQGTGSGSTFNTWLSSSQSMLRWGDKQDSDTKTAAQTACPSPTNTCLDTQATNYGGPLPCTYASTSPTGGGTTIPPSGQTYPGQYYPPTYTPTAPAGYWVCNTFNMGTPYETRSCTWVTPHYNRLASRPMSLSRLVAPSAPARAQSNADLPSVFVIVSDRVPADAIGIIERHATGSFRNVLLVPSSTVRPAVFVAAMQALYDSRGQDGEAPAKDLSITLRGTILDQQIPSTARDYAAGFTALIASAKRGFAGSYGDQPIVEFKLGPRR
jgi:hypothetical protein